MIALDEAKRHARYAASQHGAFRKTEAFDEALSALLRRSVGKTFPSDGQRRAWCDATARGAAKDTLRKACIIGQKGRQAPLATLEAAYDVSDDEPLPAERISRAEQESALARAVNALSQITKEDGGFDGDEARCILLRLYFQGATLKQLGAEQGISEAGMCIRVAQYRKALKPILERELDSLTA